MLWLCHQTAGGVRTETKPKKKWPDKHKKRYEKLLILTTAEGVQLLEVLAQYNCANISQLCKRIVRGELELKLKSGAD